MSIETLTSTQRTVFGHLIDGLSDKEIAHKLGCAANTARQHVKNILEKLECSSRVKLIVRHYKGML